MKILYYLITILLLISCTSHSGKLEQALDLAEDNRAEMEKVLSYFKKKGRIPYKSACFIIENMPYHKSRVQIVVDSGYDSFFRKTDSIYISIFGKMQPSEALLAEPKQYDSLRVVDMKWWKLHLKQEEVTCCWIVKLLQTLIP